MSIITHYTKLSILLNHIFEQYMFRLNTLSQTNDPFEYSQRVMRLTSSREIPLDKFPKVHDSLILANHILKNKIKIGCFVRDSGDEEDISTWSSIKHPALWAHYGDNSSGVALIFNKESLLKECKSIVNLKWQIKARNVDYTSEQEDLENPYMLEYENIHKFSEIELAQHIFELSEYWFYKHSDWQNEEEFRIMIYTDSKDPVYINIRPSLRAVIFGEKVSQFVRRSVGEYCNKQNIEPLSIEYNADVCRYFLRRVKLK